MNTKTSTKNFLYRTFAVFMIVMLALAAMPVSQAYATTATFTAAGSGNFTVPAGVTSLTIECWGGGGGGANRTSRTVGGGGGGGGAYAKTNSLSVTPGQVISYTVGAGGAQNTAGGTTSFTGACSAVGGSGTSSNSATGAVGGLASASTGDVKYNGGRGYTWSSGSYGAGGGGSAGTAAAGNNTAATNATDFNGATAVTGGGPGGAGSNGAGNGSTPASGPGGGGGGAYRFYTGTRSGGAGRAGQITITYFANQSTLTVTGPASVTYGSTGTITTTGGSGTGAMSYSAGASTGCTVGSSTGVISVTDASGTCVVTATKAGDATYNPITSAGFTVTLNKATPTATLAVDNSPVTYDTSAKSATVTISASSVAGSVSNILTGGAATQTNANTYAVTADFVPTDSVNYNTLTGLSAGNFIINKATPVITWNDPADITYGTALSGTQLNASSTVSGTFAYTPAAGTVLDAGNGQVLSVDFTSTDSNYEDVLGPTASINVLKATPVITWNDPADITYGTALSGTQLNASSSASGTFAYTPAAGTVLDAGNGQALSVDFTSTDSNYEDVLGTTASINVLTAPLSVTANDDSKSYDGLAYSGGNGVAYSGFVNGDDSADLGGALTYGGTSQGAIDAGPYTIVPGGLTSSNYAITFNDGTLNVSPVALSVTANNDGKVYDKVAYSGGNDVAYSGFVNSENSSVLGGTLTYGGTSQGAINVGNSYTIIPGGLTSSNYTIGFNSGTLTISPVALTITAQHDDRVYDGTTSSSVAPQITSGALVAPDTATLVQVFNNKNVGTGKTLSAVGSTISDGNSGNNYAVSFLADTTGVITQYDLEVTAATDSKEYDGNVTSAGIPTISLGSLQTGDSATWTQTFDNKNADTGKTLTPAGTVDDGNGGANYNVAFNTVSNGSITQRAITVTAVTDTKGYDGDATSAGTPTITGTIAPSDTAAFTQSFENRNVGTGKTLTPAGAVSDGNSGNNYVVNLVEDTTGEITIRNIEVTAASVNKTYDGTNSSIGVPTITSGSLVGGDSATWTQSYSDQNAANGKTLTPDGSISDANGGLNYNISFVTALGNITPADLTVTANDKTIHFGNSTPAFDYSVAGFISPDTFLVEPVCSVDGTPTAIGIYTITCDSGDAGTNYAIDYVDGTYTITSKVILDVTASSATITYGDADPVITPSYSGFIDGDDALDLTTAPTCSATGPFTVTGSPYTSSCSGGLDDKYDFNFINGSVDVNPKALTITADNASKVYGSIASFTGAEFTTSALVGTDSVTSVTLTSTGTVATATVGSYDLVPSDAIGTGLGNYAITYANGTLTVDPKALTITADNASKTYGTAQTFIGTEFAAPGLVNGDLVSSVTLTSTGAAATATVGGYAIVPSDAVGTGLSNYTIGYANGTLTVNQTVLTVTANNQTIHVGDSDPAFTFEYSGFVNGENAAALATAPNCTVSGAHLAAGAYPIVCSGGVAVNYNFDYVDGILTVTAVTNPPALLPTPWIGGISITADKNIVAVGRPHIGAEVASYDGFSAGAHTAYVPMLFKNSYGGSYDSALYIQNVDSALATVSIKYYDSLGNLTCTAPDTISPLASKGYWLPGLSATCLPDGWVGGAVVTSDKNIVANGRPHIGAEVMTYDSFSAGSLTSSLPMLFKNAYGGTYDSAFYVQNVDTTNTAALNIKYYDSMGTLTCTVTTETVAPLASKGYWLPGLSAACIPDGWVGGVVITSTAPIVTVGRPHVGTQITTYNGFSAGSGYSSLPMLFKNAYGGSYDAAFYVQNLNPSTTANLNIKYYDLAGTLTCTVTTETIAPLASKGYWLPGLSAACLPDGWIGGAVVTSNVDIVAIGRPHIGAQVTTYNGFTAGSLSTSLPMLFKDAFGGSYDSAFYVQNTESTAATVITKFYDSTGALTCTRNDTLAGFSTLSLWTPSLTCVP